MSLRALFDAPCALCGALILAGEVTRPLSAAALYADGDRKQDSLNPSDGDPVPDRIVWSHLMCAPSNDDPRVPVCKHWKRRGSCVFRISCLFRHPLSLSSNQPGGAKGSEEIQRGRRGRRLRRRIFNDGRAAALRRWVLDVFGDSYLRSGSGVLDVAGGKGEVAFELENLNGIPTCVVDPRAMELNRYCRKLEFGYYHRNTVLGRYNPRPKPQSRGGMRAPTQIRGFFEMSDPASVSDADSRGVFIAVVSGEDTGSDGHSGSDKKIDEDSSHHSATNIDVSTVGTGAHPPFHFPDILVSKESFAAGLHVGQQIRWTTKGLEEDPTVTADTCEEDFWDNNAIDLASAVGNLRVSEDQCASSVDAQCTTQSHSSEVLNHNRQENMPISTVPDSTSDLGHFPRPREVTSFKEARSIVQDCSMVLGMHPDQAAEHILDFALRNNKPCAFIPCCVYARQFPRRRTAAGTPVRKYGELVEYLLGKLSVCVLCSDPAASSTSTDTSSCDYIPPSLAQFGIVEMDFEGKNLLIFYTAGRPLLADPYAVQAHVSRGPAQLKHWWALSDTSIKDRDNSLSREVTEDSHESNNI